MSKKLTTVSKDQKLTEKQERFSLAYLETGNASEAYRRSYSPKKMAAKTVNEEASRLMADPKIAARITELRQPAVEKAQYTLDLALKEAHEAFEIAKLKENGGAMATAVQLKAKLCGLLSDNARVELTGANGGPIESRNDVTLTPGEAYLRFVGAKA